MKKIMLGLIALIPIVLIFTIQLTSVVLEATTYIAVEKVMFSTDEMTIKKTDSNNVRLEFPATVLPVAATDKSLIYESNNEDVAVVDNFGNITFKKFGYVTITAKSSTATSVSDKCEFFVTDDKIHEVHILNKMVGITKGESYKLQTQIIPAEAIDKNLLFESSSEDVATISPDGTITAVEGGFTTITVKSLNGKEDSFNLQVVVPVEGIQIIGSDKLTTGLATAQFPTVEFQPHNATNKNIIYSSGDVSVATISSSGEILFNKVGEVEFTATATGGHMVKYRVEYTGGLVKGAEIVNASIGLNYTFADMNSGIIPIEIKVTPADAIMSNVWLESSNETAVKIIDGEAVVVGGGKAIITMKANAVDGSIITSTKEVYITRPATEIVVNNTPTEPINTREYAIDYTVITADHTDTIIFSVDSDIASVTSTGVVNFNAPGEVVVTITANQNVKKDIAITYVPGGAVSYSIIGNNQTLELGYGDNFVLIFDELSMGVVDYDISGTSANGQPVLIYDANTQIFSANAGGNCVITAIGDSEILVNVRVIRNVQSINYTLNGVQLTNGEVLTAKKEFEINANILPLDANIQDIHISTSDNNIAVIDGNMVKFLMSGTVTITLSAKTNPNTTDTISTTFTAFSSFGLPTNFEVSNNMVIADVGLTSQVVFGDVFAPSDYELNINHFTFVSDNPNVASVDNNGVITGNSWGFTNIYVSTASSLGTITKTVQVEVQEKSDSIDFIYNNKVLNGGYIIGDSIQLSSKILPTTTNNQAVRYYISEIIDGDESDITIDENTGLLTFNNAVSVKVTVETVDNGTTKTIYLKRIVGPDELQVYYNDNIINELIKIEANGANPVIKARPIMSTDANYPDGILDLNLADIEYDVIDETGLTSTLTASTSGGYRYFTIEPTKTIVKSLSTTITFRYGTATYPISIKFFALQGISLALDNKDDADYGLEQRRVFGSYSHKDGQWESKLDIEFTNTPDNVQDQLYWFVKASDSNWAYFESSTTGVFRLQVARLNEALSTMTEFEEGYAYPTIKVTIFVGNESDYTLYDDLLNNPSTDPTFKWDYYTYTIVCGCNIFDGDDFDYAWQKYQRMVLHANIGTEEDRVAGQNFGVMSEATKNAACHMVDVYGNGYTLNFNGHLGNYNSVNEINIAGEGRNIITNVNYKGANVDTTKKSYTRSMTFGGGIMQYCTVQGFDLLYVGRIPDDRVGTIYNVTEFYKCIFRHMSHCGLQLDGQNRKMYIEDCIIYDVAQCAVDFQQGELYIKGFLDIYNFVTPKEYDSTYQSVIRDVFKSNEFANYVDKSGSEPMANVGILIIKLSSKPKVDTVYFWNPSTNQYEANIDNGTGHSYTKISKEQRILYVLKVYIHMWLTNINTTSIKPTDVPDITKIRRIK